MTNEETVYKILKMSEVNPELFQRQIFSVLGISLGKGHYVLKSLMNLGWVKLNNFIGSRNKLGYAYVLTPIGIAEKAAITFRFLVRKQRECSALQAEIQALRAGVETVEEGNHCSRRRYGQTN